MRRVVLALCTLVGANFCVGPVLAQQTIQRPGDICRLSDDEALGLEEEGSVPLAPETTPSPAAASRQLLTANCGRDRPLWSTLRDGTVSVPTTSGLAVEYIPLFLEDKDNFTCVAIRPSVACVTRSEPTSDGGVRLQLASRSSRHAARVWINVPPDGGRVGNTLHTDNFVLLRRVRGSTDVITRSYRDANGYPCSGGDCGVLRALKLQRVIMQFVRQERYPWPSRGQLQEDIELFLQTTGDIALSRDGHALHQLLVRNEIGWTGSVTSATRSPFIVGDAVLLSSGPSFGPYQIDLATNGVAAELGTFRDALLRVAYQSHDPELQYIAEQNLFMQPVRQFNVRTLSLFHRSIPALRENMRTPEMSGRIRDLYASYLHRSEQCMSALREVGEPFQSSLLIRLVLFDLDNLKGTGHAVSLADYARIQGQAGADDLASLENRVTDEALRRQDSEDARATVAQRIGAARIVARLPTKGDELQNARCVMDGWSAFVRRHTATVRTWDRRGG